MKKKALITGGAGFIGANLANRLLREGWNISILDNLSRKGSKKNLEWIAENWKNSKFKVVIADVRNYDALRTNVADCDVVFHLAAQVAVTTSFVDPRLDFEVNALGSFNVLEAARQRRNKPIVIFASTNKVYGKMENVHIKLLKSRYAYSDFKNGISENFPLDFHSPYGCSNGAADQYTRDYWRMYKLPTVVFRQSCIYGPRQMGMEDQGWVAYMAICAYMKRPITIYGNGKQVRDLLHVDDLISAYMAAVEKINKVHGEIYNIGGGSEHSFSILEYINFLEIISGQKVRTKFSDWRPGDQKVYISNTKKLEKELGWKVRICHKDGLKQLYQWVVLNKSLFKLA